MRDERPWAGPAPPAAFYLYSPDRKGEHAEALLSPCRGFLHADGYAGFNTLYAAYRVVMHGRLRRPRGAPPDSHATVEIVCDRPAINSTSRLTPSLIWFIPTLLNAKRT